MDFHSCFLLDPPHCFYISCCQCLYAWCVNDIQRKRLYGIKRKTTTTTTQQNMDLCLLLFHYQIFQEGRSKSNWQVFFSFGKCQVHISEGEGKAWWASTLTERLTERGRFTEEAVHVIHELHLQADNFSSQQPLALIYVSLLYVWVSTYFHRGDLKDVCYNYWKLFILEYAEIAAPCLILWFMLISVYLKHMILNHSLHRGYFQLH